MKGWTYCWRAIGGAATLLLDACTAPPPPIQVPVAEPILPPPTDAFAVQVLGLHNEERAEVGAPPMQWDPALADAAAAYAADLTRIGMLRHSARETRPGQGENLWMGTRRGFTPWLMVGSWSSEKSRFRPGVFPDVSNTGNWVTVGHYTQMIWRGSTRLGCAIRSSARDDFLVCRYASAGNVLGMRVP